jgi:hypothetical protein
MLLNHPLASPADNHSAVKWPSGSRQAWGYDLLAGRRAVVPVPRIICAFAGLIQAPVDSAVPPWCAWVASTSEARCSRVRAGFSPARTTANSLSAGLGCSRINRPSARRRIDLTRRAGRWTCRVGALMRCGKGISGGLRGRETGLAMTDAMCIAGGPACDEGQALVEVSMSCALAVRCASGILFWQNLFAFAVE